MPAPVIPQTPKEQSSPPQEGFQNFSGSGEGALRAKEVAIRILARWPWIVLFFGLGISFGFYRVWSSIPLYQAKASVWVKDRTDNGVGSDSSINVGSFYAITTVRENFYNSELSEKVASDPKVRRLRNLKIPSKPSLLKKILGKGDTTGEEVVEAPPSHILGSWIKSWMRAKERKDSRIIDVVVRHSDPEVAATVANTLITTYINSRTDKLQQEQRDEVKFMDVHALKAEQDIENATSILSSYANPLEAEKELGEAESELEVLSLRYKGKHPKYKDAKGRVDKLRGKFRNALRRAVNYNTDDKNIWGDFQKALEENDSEDDIEELRDRLISRKEVLESEIQIKKTQFERIIERSEVGDIAVDTTEAEVIVNEHARLPGAPYSPNKNKLISQSSTGGLLIGIVVAFLFYRIDNKLHTVSDVERTFKLPVLAAIEEIDPAVTEDISEEVPEEDNAWVSEKLNWSPFLVFRSELVNSHYTEMFRVLRTAVTLLGPVKTRKFTLVTSSLPSEGKTFVASNFATSLAQQGYRVLLVDMDLRKPRVHEMFGKERDEQPGVVEFLAGLNSLQECVYNNTGQANLSVMLAGHRSPNPGELLDSYSLGEMLSKFKHAYEHVVLDTAPLLAVPDTRIIAPYVNNILLVLRALRTPRGAIERALRLLGDNNIKPHGIVFNGYVESRLRVGDNYSYGYYGTNKKGRMKYGTYGEVYGEKDGK